MSCSVRECPVSSPFNTKAFKTLKAEWDAKLADSGFVDIESADLEKDKKRRALARDSVENAARELYYSYAAEFVHVADWPRVADRQIWELHSEGLSVREIASKLCCGNRLVQYRLERTRARMFEWRRANRG